MSQSSGTPLLLKGGRAAWASAAVQPNCSVSWRLYWSFGEQPTSDPSTDHSPQLLCFLGPCIGPFGEQPTSDPSPRPISLVVGHSIGPLRPCPRGHPITNSSLTIHPPLHGRTAECVVLYCRRLPRSRCVCRGCCSVVPVLATTSVHCSRRCLVVGFVRNHYHISTRRRRWTWRPR